MDYLCFFMKRDARAGLIEVAARQMMNDFESQTQ